MNVNLVYAVLIALPATITAIATLVTAVRTSNKLTTHNEIINGKIDDVKEVVNGRMEQLVKSSVAQGRIEEQNAQKEKAAHV